MGYYPEAIFVPFIDTTTLITHDIADVDQLIRTSLNTSGALTTDVNIPQTISNLTIASFTSAGNDTEYDKTFQWVPPITGKVDKFFLNFAILMNMSARSSNQSVFDSVEVTLTKGGEDRYFFETFPTGLAAFDAANESRIFIVAQPIWGNSFFVRGGSAIDIRIKCNVTQTATNTFQMGMVPFFPTSLDVLSKFFSQSGIIFHISEPASQTATELGQ